MSRSLPDQTIALLTTLPSAGSIVESPLTLIKTRMESSLAFQYTGIIQVRSHPIAMPSTNTRRCQALRAVHQAEGAAGLMRGWAPTLARDAP
jgi:hypothetical protein